MLQCHIFLTNHTSIDGYCICEAWWLHKVFGTHVFLFVLPCITFFGGLFYRGWLATQSTPTPLPPVFSGSSCQDGYNGTVCGMFSVADILHIADVIWRVVLMYSCCTFHVGRQWFGYFFFAKCMKFSAVLYCSTKLTQPHPRGFLVVVFFACDYPIAILLTSFSGNWKHLPNLVNNSSL